MAGTINVALIPYHSVAASSVLNTPTQALETEVNKHIQGTGYNHLLAEIVADQITGETASGTGVSSAVTSLYVRSVQWARVLDKIMDGETGGTDWAAKYAALSPNANLSNLYAIINARTSIGTVSTIVTRDATGSFTAAGITATAAMTAPTFNGALNGNANTASSAASVPASGITGTIPAASIDVAIARAANVPSNTGTGATGSWGISVTGSAGSVAAVNITGTMAMNQIAGIPFTKILDLQATANGTNMVVAVKGGALVNANGNLRLVNDGNVTLAAPTTGNQWAVIHYDVNATSPSVTYGTVGGNSDTAILPVGSTPITWAFLRQNCTAITQTDDTISTHGYLVARPQFIALQSTAAAGGGAVVAPATVGTIGAPSTAGAPNGISIQAILNGTAAGTNINGVSFTPYPSGVGVGANVGLAAISTGNNGGGTTDALLSDLLSGAIGSTFEKAPHLFLTVSGANVTMAAGANLMINGHLKANTNNLTVSLTSGSSTSGLRYIFADSTSGATGNQYTMTVVATTFAAAAPAAPNANSRLIAVVHYSSTDGADPASIDFGPFGLVAPSQHRLGALYATPVSAGTVTMTNATWTKVNTFTPIKLKRAKAMSFTIVGAIRVINPTVRSVVGASLRINAGGEADATNGANIDISNVSTGTVDPTYNPDYTIPLGPLVWNIGPGTDYLYPGAFQNTAGSTLLYWCWVLAIPSAI